MSGRDLERKSQLILVCSDSGDPDRLSASTSHCLPFPPSSHVTHHPRGMVSHTSFKRLVSLDCYPILSCALMLLAFILPLLLERTSCSRCQCDKCFLTLFISVLFVASSLFIEHHVFSTYHFVLYLFV